MTLRIGFDSIEWNFISGCLEVFGFGADLKKMGFHVSNNGLHSDFFNLERGVRQGDPLSLVLLIFITAVELLAIAI